MNKRKIFLLGITLLVLLLTASGAMASVNADYGLDWNVIGGGGDLSTGSTYAVHGTVSQTADEVSGGTTYDAYSGFWYGLLSDLQRIFLPLIHPDLQPAP